MIWLTTLYTLSDVCDCSLFFFRYCILKSSNTPQNLETPILWSKTKKREKGRDWVPLIFTSLRKLMACRHVSKRDALATVNPSNREGETSACGVESQKNKKKPRRTDGEEIASRRASNAPPGSCSWLAQPNPTTTVWAYRWGGRPQGGLGAVAPRCIGKGVSDLVSYRHQNEVLYRLWGRLVLKQPQALCELDRPFVKIYRYI